MSGEKIDFKYLMEHQKSLNKNLKAKANDKILEYDLKIVSFRIGQEFYGIDIMNIKEILKEKKFTPVPNTLDFVTGVFNLRGEIMPVIDLAKMFHLQSMVENTEVKSIIVVKVENLILGLIVDQIQHVISLRKSDIQPPSPLLGTINERYINGVLELNNKLYVLLDVESIFSDKEKSKRDILPQSTDLAEEFFTFFCNQLEEFSSIHVNEHNKMKFRELFGNYAKENNLKETPVLNKNISDKIVKEFYSKFTSELWQQPYVDHFLDAVTPKLNKICSEEIRILVMGCGSGHEAFSIYFLLNNDFKDAIIKMIAADMNLNSISGASRFEITSKMIPSWINKDKYFFNTSSDVFKVKKEISDRIFFEFHNAQNISTYKKEFDIVIARDMSLALSEAEYLRFLNDLIPKITSGGIYVIGDNEELSHPELTKVNSKDISIYLKK